MADKLKSMSDIEFRLGHLKTAKLDFIFSCNKVEFKIFNLLFERNYENAPCRQFRGSHYDAIASSKRAIHRKISGESGRRQPVHTVYGGAHLLRPILRSVLVRWVYVRSINLHRIF